MRFMMLMYPGPKAETGALPDEKGVAAMMKYNEELRQAGVLLALDGLQPTAKGARVLFSSGHATVTDGPFAETKELIGGYWMLEVKSREEAIAWAKRCPGGPDEMIEVRQVFEMSDFPHLSPALQADAESLGKALQNR